MSTKTHMSVKALADRWDCHRSNIYRLVDSRQIDALHINQAIRIPIAAVEAYEAKCTTAAKRGRRGAA